MSNTSDIDFDNQEQLYALMDKACDIPELLSGFNNEGERVFVGISKKDIVVKTWQSNGWTRIHTYTRDGLVTESFEREKEGRADNEFR